MEKRINPLMIVAICYAQRSQLSFDKFWGIARNVRTNGYGLFCAKIHTFARPFLIICKEIGEKAIILTFKRNKTEWLRAWKEVAKAHRVVCKKRGRGRDVYMIDVLRFMGFSVSDLIKARR